MEEIKKVDHRAFISVYETDRNSEELLAKTYHVISKQVPPVPGQPAATLNWRLRRFAYWPSVFEM